MQPVFVIGYPRSGTTLLLHFLLSSAAFPRYQFDESHYFSHYYRRYGKLTKPRSFQRFCDAVFNSQWFQKSEITPKEMLEEFESQPCDYASFFSTFMELLAKKQGYNRWLEKTPWHMKYVKEIKTHIPEAKFLFIVRDPRDVIFSIENYGWNQGLLNGPVRVAVAWLWHIRKAKKDLDKWPDDVLYLRYEDLVTNPDSTAKKISGFLNCDIDPNRVQDTSHGVMNKTNSSFKDDSPGKSSVYRWKTNPDDALLQKINYALGSEPAKYQYDIQSRGKPRIKDRIAIHFLKIVYSLGAKLRDILFPLVRK